MLAFQQLHTPPGEEVRCVAVVLPGARSGRRVLVPHQRSLLAKVAQGAMVTLGADVANVQPGLVSGPGWPSTSSTPDPPRKTHTVPLEEDYVLSIRSR